MAGFEPATSCSQSRRDNRATLHPDGVENQYSIERSLCRACHGTTPRKNILPKFSERSLCRACHGTTPRKIKAERQGLEPWRQLPVDRLAICSVTTPAPLLIICCMNVFLRVQM